MSNVIDWIFDHARTVFVILAMALIGGVGAYESIPREGRPDIDIPFLYVSAPFPGVSVQDNEILVAQVLEEELSDLSGLKESTSYVSDGHTGVFLEFDVGFEKEDLLAELRAKLDDARPKLPDDLDDPTIVERSIADTPIISITLAGPVPQRTLTRVADRLADDLLDLPRVKEVEVAGAREEVVEVLIDPLKLEAYEVTLEQLLQATSANNTLVQAGDVRSDQGAFAVKLSGTYSNVDDVAETSVISRNGRTLTIGDVAEIRRTYRDRATTARIDGEPAVLIEVQKSLGANVFDAVADVERTVAEEVERWPEALQSSVKVSHAFDDSTNARRMIDHLENAVATAVTLILVLTIILLGIRPALLVSIAIPCSFLITFTLLALFGLSINNMVMFGLTLSVGMLIDGAIVVVEYADRRRSEGLSGTEAFREASKRMFWPILASTATTLCAFLPMLFWPGIPGQFMRQLPITLIFVLSASLIVALVFLPVIGAATHRSSAGPRRIAAGLPGSRVDNAFVAKLFRWLIRRPATPFVCIAAVGGMIGTVGVYYMQHNHGVEFFVNTEPERVIAYVRARGNLSFEESNRLVREVEERTANVPGVRTQVGSVGSASRNPNRPSDAIGDINFELEEWGTRPNGEAIIQEIVRRGTTVPGILLDVTVPRDGPQTGKPVSVELASSNWEQLLASTRRVRDFLERSEGYINIEDNRPLPGIEWDLHVDRARAATLGADIQSVGALVRLLTDGVSIGEYRPLDSSDELDIIARFPIADRSLDTIEQLRLRTPSGLIPLSSVVHVEPRPAVDAITRREGLRWIGVSSDVAEGFNANRKIREIQTWLSQEEFPPEVTITVAGQLEEQQESQRFLSYAFGFALLLMFAVLLLEFNNFFSVLVVLLSVVLSFSGVMIGMLVMEQPFSVIMTGIGVVALAGIVVNNNIILVDTYQSLCRRMHELDAISGAVARRIRPVLLTTVTTMAGLCPMMFAVSINFYDRDIEQGNPSALWWAQLATAIVFGLGFSTILTLVVTPSALAARYWIAHGMRKLSRWAGLLTGSRRRALEHRSRLQTWIAWNKNGGDLVWTEADNLLPTSEFRLLFRNDEYLTRIDQVRIVDLIGVGLIYPVILDATAVYMPGNDPQVVAGLHDDRAFLECKANTIALEWRRRLHDRAVPQGCDHANLVHVAGLQQTSGYNRLPTSVFSRENRRCLSRARQCLTVRRIDHNSYRRLCAGSTGICTSPCSL